MSAESIVSLMSEAIVHTTFHTVFDAGEASIAEPGQNNLKQTIPSDDHAALASIRSKLKAIIEG